MANRSVSVTLLANVAGYVAGIKTAAAATRDFGSELTKAAEKGRADSFIHTATAVGTGLVGAFGVAVFAAAKFDKEMSAVSAATNATAGDLDRLRDAALEAGKSTAFSATEAAKAQTELAKAGVATGDILSGGLKGALDLAAAGQMEVAEAAEVAATAMVQFGLSGRDIPHVADLLAAAAGKAQGEVHDVGMALKQAGLVASQFGLSVEETTGTLAAFASAGLLGSDAGTSLKTMLLRLAAPAGEAADLMARLGIAAYDSQGNFVGLEALAGQLHGALSGLTQAERDAALATIFGSDAIRAANVLYREGAGGIDEWTRKVNDQGFAADVAAKKTDNLAGDLERLKGALETLLIESGSGSNAAGLRMLVQAVGKLVEGFSALPGPVQQFLVAAAGLSGVTLLAAAGFLKAREMAALLNRELIAMGPAGAAAAAGLARVKTAAAALTAGAGVVGALIAVLAVVDAMFGKSAEMSAAQIKRLSAELEHYGKTGKVAGEATKALGADMSKFADDIKVFGDDWWSRFGTGLATVLETITFTGHLVEDSARHARESIDNIDKALAGLVSSGHVDEAEAAFERLRAAAAKQGISVRELEAAFPAYFAALEDSKQAADAAGIGAQTLAAGLEAAVAAGKSLIDVFAELNGQAISYARAEVTAVQSVDALTESLQRNGRSFDVNTAKGQANRLALLDAVEAAAKAAQAKYEETGSVEAASAEYDRHVAALRRTLRAAGLTEGQINSLIGTYGRMPGAVVTAIRTPGLGAAQATARGLKGTLQWLNGRHIVITTDIRGDTYARVPGGRIPERHGGIVHAAANGMVTPAHVAAGTRIKWAEPETGGEAFIPRFGDRERSRSIVDVAAGWHGGSVDWSGQHARSTRPRGQAMAGQRVQVNVQVRQVVDVLGADQEFARLIRRIVKTDGGGDVQQAFGRR